MRMHGTNGEKRGNERRVTIPEITLERGMKEKRKKPSPTVGEYLTALSVCVCVRVRIIPITTSAKASNRLRAIKRDILRTRGRVCASHSRRRWFPAVTKETNRKRRRNTPNGENQSRVRGDGDDRPLVEELKAPQSAGLVARTRRAGRELYR